MSAAARVCVCVHLCVFVVTDRVVKVYWRRYGRRIARRIAACCARVRVLVAPCACDHSNVSAAEFTLINRRHHCRCVCGCLCGVADGVSYAAALAGSVAFLFVRRSVPPCFKRCLVCACVNDCVCSARPSRCASPTWTPKRTCACATSASWTNKPTLRCALRRFSCECVVAAKWQRPLARPDSSYSRCATAKAAFRQGGWRGCRGARACTKDTAATLLWLRNSAG